MGESKGGRVLNWAGFDFMLLSVAKANRAKHPDLELEANHSIHPATVTLG